MDSFFNTFNINLIFHVIQIVQVVRKHKPTTSEKGLYNQAHSYLLNNELTVSILVKNIHFWHFHRYQFGSEEITIQNE